MFSVVWNVDLNVALACFQQTPPNPVFKRLALTYLQTTLLTVSLYYLTTKLTLSLLSLVAHHVVEN